jgi:type II secretory pathway pseudopilin PulG
MKQRDRLVLAILGVVGVMAAVWFLAISPKRADVKVVDEQVTAAEQRRDAAVSGAAGAEQAKANYRQDYATVARLGKAVPAKADVPSLVYQLESAARAAKVDFRSIAVQSATAAPAPAPAPNASKGPASAGTSSAGIEPTSFQFTFQGNFLSLRRLLSEVGRFSRVKGSKVSVSGRLLTIDSVALNPSEKGLPNIKAEVKASAYVAAIPAALPGSLSPQMSGAATAPTTTTASEVGP